MSDSPDPPRSGLRRSTSPGATASPEAVTPDRDFNDADVAPTRTGELGSEGGSYAELAQEIRARANAAGDSLTSPASAPRVGMALVWALLAIPLFLLVLWFATSGC